MIKIKSIVGRPTKYTQDLAKEICDTITSSSKGTKKLCAEHSHWPCQDTLFTWLKTHPEFSEQYAQAKRCQVEFLVDEILDIADDSSQDYAINDQGIAVFNSERVARSRLRIDTRKWIACKLVPKIYGDKPQEEQKQVSCLKEVAERVKALDKLNEREY